MIAKLLAKLLPFLVVVSGKKRIYDERGHFASGPNFSD
jgi:mannitol-specific phosphotransferase system IIBC component